MGYKILNTKTFDFEKAAQAPGWLKEIRGQYMPETLEYGVSSFTFQSRLPMHPKRLYKFLNTKIPGLIRAKGFFWLASQPDFVGTWSLAGISSVVESNGIWWAAAPVEYWQPEQSRIDLVESYFEEPFGDRKQEFVFIGIGMNQEKILENLNKCLLTTKEFNLGFEKWSNLSDPFPRWVMSNN